jgi:predicted porin
MTASANQVSTGLLPSALGIGAHTRENDLDVAVQFTFFTGANSSAAGSGAYNSGLAGGNSLNIRQAFLSFGDKSWGTIKMGRDLGVFGSDAILSDMTLLGVGTGAGGAGNSTLGRIGSGYLYADWVGQIQYQSPNFNGFQLTGSMREPALNSTNHNVGWDGKATYSWAQNDASVKVWAGGLFQKIQTADVANGPLVQSIDNPGVDEWSRIRYTSSVGSAGYKKDVKVAEIGAKATYAGATLVGYYYDGQNYGTSTVANGTPLSGLLTASSGPADQNVKGGYVQATYVLPTKTTIGASWGESRIDANSDTADAVNNCSYQTDDYKNESWIVGVYHPLTKHLNLVGEYTDTKYTNISNVSGYDGHQRTVAAGAILFF